LLKNPASVISNGVCEVRNLSFLGILIEEGFLASLRMTAKRFFQQAAGEEKKATGWASRAGAPIGCPEEEQSSAVPTIWAK
jgi:hypothetical protein